MPEREGIRVDGTVKEALPNAVYRVELEGGQRIQAHVSSELRLSVVRVLPGDRVTVEIAPRDFSRGRIVARK
jgi:translation initiation factor IF-1